MLDFKEENTKNSKIPIGILDENGSQQLCRAFDPLTECKAPPNPAICNLSTTHPPEPPYFAKAGILEFPYIYTYLSIFFSLSLLFYYYYHVRTENFSPTQNPPLFTFQNSSTLEFLPPFWNNSSPLYISYISPPSHDTFHPPLNPYLNYFDPNLLNNSLT